MCLITVICPTYNCEKYIQRTINSIINQTIGFENIELILVDDCSTDSTKDIIKKYSKEYENIVPFFLKENHGFPGFGRNLGIKKSKSEYIMFIDNDDEYLPEYCERMYNSIKYYDIDVISSNFQIIEKENIVNDTIFQNVINDESINIISKDCENNNLIVSLKEFYYLRDPEVWNKIFKKEIIQKNQIKFIENSLNEDTLFLYNYYEYANKLMYIDFYGYKWYRDSENLSYHSTKVTLAFISSFYEILSFLNKSSQKIDSNKLFSFHVEEALINCLFIPNKDIKFTLKKLYEFEEKISFSGKLRYPWNNLINKFVLKKQLNMGTFLIITLKYSRLFYRRLFNK